MTSRLAAVLTAVLTAVLALVLAVPAAAVDVDGVASRLGDDPVLVDEASTIQPDEDAVRAAVEDLPVPTYVVVLPQAAVDREDSGIDGVLLRVVDALGDPRAVVVVVTDGGELQAGEGGASGVQASALLDAIVQSRSDQQFDGQALTGALLEFAEGVKRDGQEGGERGVTSSSRRTVGVAGLIGVALVAAGLLWTRSQRRVRQQAPLTDVGEASGRW